MFCLMEIDEACNETSSNESHRIRTYNISKISLSCLDAKRYTLSDGINYLAYFQKGVRKVNERYKHKMIFLILSYI